MESKNMQLLFRWSESIKVQLSYRKIWNKRSKRTTRNASQSNFCWNIYRFRFVPMFLFFSLRIKK